MHAIARWFVRERSPSKVAAVYGSAAAAQDAARRVRSLADVDDRQVQLVRPIDPAWERKVEPESVGIRRTAVHAHLTCGTLGFAIGVVAWLVLDVAGTAAIVNTPGASFVALVFLSTAFGLLAGGLVTFRPDHDLVIEPVREAMTEGNWAVIVHPVSPEQRRRAAFALRATDARVSETL